MDLELREEVGAGVRRNPEFLIQVSVDLWSGESCSEFKTDRGDKNSQISNCFAVT